MVNNDNDSDTMNVYVSVCVFEPYYYFVTIMTRRVNDNLTFCGVLLFYV